MLIANITLDKHHIGFILLLLKSVGRAFLFAKNITFYYYKKASPSQVRKCKAFLFIKSNYVTIS